MNQIIQTTGIIRQRGQLTLPDNIRDNIDWATAGSIVTIKTTKSDEIVIQPYSPQKEIDWDKLWRDLNRIRSYKGKYHGSLSKFIIKDRETRR